MVRVPEAVAVALPDYELGAELGAGASGRVFRGRHRGLGRPAAIKVLSSVAQDGAGARFASEARLLASFDHPHIVRVYDFREHGDLRLIIMELLAGGTLTSRWKGISPEGACALGLAVADALHYAHGRGVLHRDVKPDNMLFDKAGGSGVPVTVKVADFGIAKIFESRRDVTASVVGTPRYMAPEQIMGSELGPAADMYSLAVVLYELLARAPMFGSRLSEEGYRFHHVYEAPLPLPGEVPAGVANVLMRALEKNPDDRHPSARVFAVELAEAAARGFGAGWLRRSGMLLTLGPEVQRAGEQPSHDDDYDLSTKIIREPLPPSPPPQPSARPVAEATTPPSARPPNWVLKEENAAGKGGDSDRRGTGERRPAAHPPSRRPAWRRLVTVLLVLALGAAGGWQWHAAKTAEDRVEETGRKAVARELLVEADRRLESDPRLAIQLAIAAYSISGDDETLDSLYRALESTGYLGVLGEDGHGSAVRAVAFSRDSGKIAFGDDSGRIVLADVPQQDRPEPGEPESVIIREPSGKPVEALALASDGLPRLAAVSGEEEVLLWDVADPDGQPPHPRALTHMVTVNTVAFSPDGRTLATGGDDGRVFLWIASGIDGQVAAAPIPFQAHQGAVDALAFSPEGGVLATGGEDGKVFLWRLPAPEGGPPIVQWALPHPTGVTAIAFQRHDGNHLAVGDARGAVTVWSRSGEGEQAPHKVSELPPRTAGFTGRVTGLVYARDGRLVTSGEGQDVLVRDASDPSEVLGPPVSDHGDSALGLALDQSGEMLAIASRNGGVLLWNLFPRHHPRVLGMPITGLASGLAYTEHGSALFAAGTHGDSLHVWNFSDPANPNEDSEAIIGLAGFGPVVETSFTGDSGACGRSHGGAAPQTAEGKCWLAVSNDRGFVKIFDVADPENPREFANFDADEYEGDEVAVREMRFNEAGDLLATGFDDGTVRMWEVTGDRNQPPRFGSVLGGHVGAVRDVRFGGADNNILASAGDDFTVKLWDVDHSGQHLAELREPRGPVNDVVFSRDGRTLFAAGGDGHIWRWDVANPREPRRLGLPLGGREGPVHALALIGSGTSGEPGVEILAAAGEDRRVTFWDISEPGLPRRSGAVIATDAPILDISVARSADRMVVASDDHKIRIWDLAPLAAPMPDNVVELACARARGFGEDAWTTYLPDLPYQEAC